MVRSEGVTTRRPVPAVTTSWGPADIILRIRWFLGRHLSVRSKLTVWYALVVAVTLLLTGSAMTVAVNYRVETSIDQGLRRTADRMISDLRHPAGPVHLLGRCGPPADYYCTQLQEDLNEYSARVSQGGQFEQVEVLDGTQPALPSIPLKSPFAPGRASEGIEVQPQDLMARVEGTGKPSLTTVHADGDTFRVLVTPLQVPAALARPASGQPTFAVLEVFQSEHIYLDIEDALRLILLTAVPVAVLFALLSGWWIAQVALRPVNRIAQKVQTIGGSSDLSRRVNFIGPRDELGRLADTFDAMLGRLEATFESQKRFIADASHELRTPLTAIRGNADLMRIAPPEEIGECVAAIRREAERMSRLVSDLLLLAEADVEQQVIHPQPLDLSALLEDVHRSANILGQDRVAVHYSNPGPILIDGDGDRLKQLFLNLADNAIKFTPRGGEVELGLRVEGTRVRAWVRDTGIGIPQEEQSAIFDRFYRVEAARSTRGTGLGLSICSWIAQAHGGMILLDSEPGRGSTFSVILPLDHGALPAGEFQNRVVSGD